ncbi:MAG TPA: hypothetical protein VHW44_00200 [Pseudonocardiaceae bacterium]|nr:hypothetical protein [Pseudonocardiaceae bacterium]
MQRFATRALVVLGGAVAATAAAWLISSATASADTLPGGIPVSGADPVAALTSTAPADPAASTDPTGLTQPVTATATALHTAVTTLAAPPQPPTLPPPPPPPASVSTGWTTVTDQLGTALGHLGQPVNLPGAGQPPAAGTPGSTHPGPIGQPISAVPHQLRTQAQPLAAPSAVASPAAPNQLVHSARAPGRHRGGHRSAEPRHAPIPATVPSGPTGSTGTQQAPTGTGAADRADLPVLPGLTRLGTRRPTVLGRRVTDQQQPGTTPD